MTGIPAWAQDHLDREMPGNPVLNGRVVGFNKVLANTRQGAVLVRRSLFGQVRHELVETAQDRLAFRCAGCSQNLQFYNLDLPATVYCSICASKYEVDAQGTVTGKDGAVVPATLKGAKEAQCGCCADGCCEGGDCCDHAGCGACCEQTGCCKGGCDQARCCPGEACQCCLAAQAGHEGASSATTGATATGPQEPDDGLTVRLDESLLPPPAKADLHEAAPKPAGQPASAFSHNGYTLYRREVEGKAGARPLYFFSKGEPKSGEPAQLPEGHEVGINKRTGLPFLRRGASTAPTDAVTLFGFKGDSHPVIEVEGIGPMWATRLEGCGVRTTDELCRSDAEALAHRMGEAVETIRFWQQMAELMKVKGIGKQYAEALVRAGVHSIEEFKARKPKDLVESTNTWLDQQRQTVIKTRLTAQRVSTWQKHAKGMRRVKLAPHPLS
jgi:predicted flap endonuclease-1-like 5' DNA nuclease